MKHGAAEQIIAKGDEGLRSACNGERAPVPRSRAGARGRMHVRAARCVAILFAFMMWALGAADFSTGVDLYDQGDHEGAAEQWQALASQGDTRAQYRLAKMFEEGVGVRKDDRAALRWYRQAAELGSVEARYELALMYSLGRGVRQDSSRAAYWYGLLAEEGHISAQYLLAGMYEQGDGVERSVHRALHWYRQAAAQGHVRAQMKLGDAYSRGDGVDEDLAQAWAWFDLAAAKGNELAETERRSLAHRLSEEQLVEAMTFSRLLRPQRVGWPGGSEVETGPEPELELEPEPVQASEMVRIAAGCFAMGSAPEEVGRHDDELRHPSCVDEFSISRHEVTRGQYAAFVRETGRETLDGCQIYGNGGWAFRAGHSWRNPGYAQSDDHPVTCVSRDDALAYSKWLSERRGRSFRLPTEAEWEYAARTGSGAARHWGDDVGRACRWGNVGDRSLNRHYREWMWTIHPCDDGHAHTAPVGSFRVSLYGLHDMAGNVWEWTCSSYDPAYRGAEYRCASRDRSGVVRGGSWSNSPRWVRAAARFETRADARFDLVGFRLAHD